MTRGCGPMVAFAVASIFITCVLSCATVQSKQANETVPNSVSSLAYDAIGTKPVKGSSEYNQMFFKQTDDINSMILGPVHRMAGRAQISHSLVSWLRNWWAGTVLYLLSGAGHYAWNFWWKKEQNFPKGTKTLTMKPMLEQLVMGLAGLPALTILPTFAEYMVEQGWTLCYPEIEEVGWLNWAIHISAYLMFCEFWVYWFHRWLHSPLLYKHFHSSHHFYNKQELISPFAGLAFNPLDGIFQASPLVFALLVVPMHFPTYYMLFFFEEIWTANIHDTIDGGVFGILGAGYHNFHHTNYKYNYGHLTIFMDWLFGTLIDPRVGPPINKRREGQKPLKSS